MLTDAEMGDPALVRAWIEFNRHYPTVRRTLLCLRRQPWTAGAIGILALVSTGFLVLAASHLTLSAGSGAGFAYAMASLYTGGGAAVWAFLFHKRNSLLRRPLTSDQMKTLEDMLRHCKTNGPTHLVLARWLDTGIEWAQADYWAFCHWMAALREHRLCMERRQAIEALVGEKAKALAAAQRMDSGLPKAQPDDPRPARGRL